MYFRFCLYLLGAIAVAVLAAGAFSYRMMTGDARAAAEKDLANILQTVHDQYDEAAQKVRVLTDLNNNSMLASTRSIADIIRLSPQVLDDPETLQRLCNESLAESLIVCDEKGIVCASTPEALHGQVLGEDYSSLLACARGAYAERTSHIDTAGRSVRFSAVRRRDAPGVVILSFYLEHEQNAREKSNLANLITDMKVGKNGYIIAFFEGVQVNQSVLPASEAELRSLPLNQLIEQRLQDQDCFLYATVDKGLRLIGVVPTSECYTMRAMGMRLLLYSAAVLLAVVLVAGFFLLRRYVLRDIAELNVVVKRIASGSFDTKVRESSSPEFQQLTMNINTMLDSLRSHDDRISEQHQKEAELARDIKDSILPDPTRLFADRGDFSMVAAMVQADTVGGDFYDCLLADDRHLLFVIGSIDEHGMPAALHMMYKLALLRSCSNRMMSPVEIASNINRRICEGGSTTVPVAMFIGQLEIATGTVKCVNAGMHAPLLRRQNEQFAAVDLPVSAPIGESASAQYTQGVFEMQPGDRLFLCTNALTAMANEKDEFFGESRLHACLNEVTPTLRDIPHRVRASVRRFVGNRKRLCDYTMLCIELSEQRRSSGCISVAPREAAAAADMIRNKLEEVFAAPDDIEHIVQATLVVMSAIQGAPSVRVAIGCTERHARVTLTYAGPENDILGRMQPLRLDSSSYHHLDNVNDITLYKEIE